MLSIICQSIFKHHVHKLIELTRLKNGLKRLHAVNILVRCEYNFYFLWDRFKHVGDSQYLEIITSSKEIMSFHDHGVVGLRFSLSRNDLSTVIALSYHLVGGGL